MSGAWWMVDKLCMQTGIVGQLGLNYFTSEETKRNGIFTHQRGIQKNDGNGTLLPNVSYINPLFRR